MSEISKLKTLLHNNHTDSYEPVFFAISDNLPSSHFFAALAEAPHIVVHNHIEEQLKELIKCLNPGKKLSAESYQNEIVNLLNGKTLDEFGTWVYYPWNHCIVHLLNKEDFITVRTNRNKHKITQEEQKQLEKRSIGVIGLSVGQSIALTLAMERTCGELRLADFDTVELSNLNRIRAGVQKLGCKKVILAAREIAEIDPFMKVRIFDEGITDQNIDTFFTSPSRLDLLVEVCDGLNIKINSRFKARELGIPVVMDTNDRGMLDIERFDLEPQRPILHGLAEDLNPQSIADLTNEQKIPYVLDIVDAAKISSRLKATMIEIENTVSSWPQLASSVVLGGAITTDVCRRILLNEFTDSGRFYVDLDEIISVRNDAIKKAQGTQEKELVSATPIEQLLTKALADSLANKTYPFSIVESGPDGFTLQIHRDSFYQVNIFETGLILGQLESTIQTSLKKHMHFHVDEDGKVTALLTDTPGTDKALNHISTAFSITPEIINSLSELERIMHFSANYHSKLYNNLGFSSQAGNKIAFEKTSFLQFAKPLYLMLSDPEAVKYLANWNLGGAIQKITAMKLSSASKLMVFTMVDDADSLLEFGATFATSHHNSARLEPLYSFICAQLCTDMLPLYQNELIKINNKLLHFFNLTSAKKHLICLSNESQ